MGYLQTKYLEIVNNNIKVKFLGDTEPLPKDILHQMKKLEKDTMDNNKFFLNIALNYGGRDEIIRTTKKIASDILDHKININEINEKLFEQFIDTAGQKDPDLIIRTAGEKRLSNFLLWQSSYSELYFTEKLWPDFTVDALREAINFYHGRSRKFGTLKEITK